MLEQELQAKGLTAPRVTPADIAASILSEHYFTAGEAAISRQMVVDAAVARVMDSLCSDHEGRSFEITSFRQEVARRVADIAKPTFEFGGVPRELGLLTLCVLVLRNGFKVTGEGACTSPENFDAEIGRRIARANAVSKIWPLLGYELHTKLADEEIERGA